jgi:uncharacterized damage-inducible protein DinB
MKAKPGIEVSETGRIADQLQRAFHGVAWHGPGVFELLEGVNAATAAAKPVENVHSIWELLLHIEAWDRAAMVRLGGEKCQPQGEENFPRVKSNNESAWRATVASANRTHDQLVKLVEGLPDSRLRDRVPGKRYDFYHMLNGIAQHELYHAGQIAILKKAALSPRSRKF